MWAGRSAAATSSGERARIDAISSSPMAQTTKAAQENTSRAGVWRCRHQMRK
jgi:hypothetical protein